MKAAIVTGATSGIGLAICIRLMRMSYKVYGLGRDFTSVPKEVLSNPLFLSVKCDLLKANELSNLINSIKKSDEITILVNNAGVGYFGLHEELNPKKIHEMVAVNLEAPLILSQLLLRDLKKYNGYIINISSVTAKKSNPHGCAYGATKAALSNFSASLFDESRKYGVKTVSIHPDMTKTNFYRNADFKEGNAEDTFLLPEEVAEAVAMVLEQRNGITFTELTLQPQRHQIGKKI